MIVKHANPCGVAIGATALDAYTQGAADRPDLGLRRHHRLQPPVDGAAAEAVAKQFVEVLIAPSFTTKRAQIFAAKQNVRLLEIPLGQRHQPATTSSASAAACWCSRRTRRTCGWPNCRVVSKRQPTPQQLQDLMFAWRVAKFVKSNAIVFCGNGMTLGVGAGQMSRVDSARIASIKAQNAGLSLAGSAVASDAFFPFRDGLDVVVDAGATCVIQPGGSMRDQEVIDAADEQDVVMVLTGTRHFRH